MTVGSRLNAHITRQYWNTGKFNLAVLGCELLQALTNTGKKFMIYQICYGQYS